MPTNKVLVFSEKVKGWVSFRSHIDMQNGISMGNDYYTFFTGTSGNLWIHYDESISRNTFYNDYTNSSVSVVLNAEPGSVKVFNTLNYEGSQSKIDPFVSQLTPLPFQPTVTYNDQEIYNLSGKNGWYVERMFTDMEDGYINEFIGKENKWFNNVNRLIDTKLQRADTDDFTFQGIGSVSILVNSSWGCTNPLAFNYNALATVDDGSCIAVVLGCVDQTANNYDPSANTACIVNFITNGCCTYDVYGCTDMTACNYPFGATPPTIDDGSCIYPIPNGNCIGGCNAGYVMGPPWIYESFGIGTCVPL